MPSPTDVISQDKATETLITAAYTRQWSKVAELLTPEDKLNPNTVTSILQSAASHGQKDLVARLVSLKTKNAPDQVAINNAVLNATSFQQWEIVAYLCQLTTANKPSQAIVSSALRLAAGLRPWAIVVQLCALTSDNKPDAAAIAYAHKQAEEHIEVAEKDKEEIASPRHEETKDLRPSLTITITDGAAPIDINYVTPKRNSSAPTKKVTALNKETPEEHADLFSSWSLNDTDDDEPTRNEGEKALPRAEINAHAVKARPRPEKINTPPAIITVREEKSPTPDNKQRNPSQNACVAKIEGILKKYKAASPSCQSRKGRSAARQLDNDLMTELAYLKATNEADFPHALQTFKTKCIRHVTTATPSLNNELGWKTHLANLLKQIANLFAIVVPSRRNVGFFNVTKSDKQRADDLKTEITKVAYRV